MSDRLARPAAGSSTSFEPFFRAQVSSSRRNDDEAIASPQNDDRGTPQNDDRGTPQNSRVYNVGGFGSEDVVMVICPSRAPRGIKQPSPAGHALRDS